MMNYRHDNNRPSFLSFIFLLFVGVAFFLILVNQLSFSNTFIVGPNETYLTPNALYQANVIGSGDTILIHAGTYTGNEALAVWRPDNLHIIGIGGRPHLVANGAYILGKGIWVVAGHNCTVENIEFSGARVPDQNGAGIRLDGNGLNLRYCYFHDNENGILTNNSRQGDILIEYCEFENGGHGDGYSHNIYIGHAASLTFRFNYTHHAKIGHCLKSRAAKNDIRYNYFSDGDDGYSSRLVDLPNGGYTILLGNIFHQGRLAENSNLVGYGKEGYDQGGDHRLYIHYNTFVSNRSVARFVDIQDGASFSSCQLNIFAGNGTVLQGSADILGNNFIAPDIASCNFEDADAFDFHPTDQSPFLNPAVSVSPDTLDAREPVFAYAHPLESISRSPINGSFEYGAFEFEEEVSVSDHKRININVYPNPSEGEIMAEGWNDIIELQIFDYLGHSKFRILNPQFPIYANQLQPGAYLLKLMDANGNIHCSTWLKI